MRRRSSQVQELGAGVLGSGQADRRPARGPTGCRCGARSDGGIAPSSPSRQQLFDDGRGIGARRHNLDVADSVLSAAERSEGCAQLMPADARSAARNGSTIAVARPSGMRGMDTRSIGSAAATAVSTFRPSPSMPPSAPSATAAARSATEVDAARSIDRGELLQRHGARFEQPPEIGRQIGDGRFEEHPAAGFEHLAETPHHLRIGRRLATEIADRARSSESMPCCVTSAAARSRSASSAASPRIIASAASVRERAGEGGGRNRLAFQRAGFGWRLLWRLLGFRRQVRREPVDDAALERRRRDSRAGSDSAATRELASSLGSES